MKWTREIGTNQPRYSCLLVAIVLFGPLCASAQTSPDVSVELAKETAPTDEQRLEVNTLETLASFIDLRNGLLRDIKAVNQQLVAADSDAEKQALKEQLVGLEADLRAISRNFENIAAGIDISILRAEQATAFSLQQELIALLKPALDEMKDMTSHVRKKAELREQISDYEKRLPVLESALANVDRLLTVSNRKPVTQGLKLTAEAWRKQLALLRSELKSAEVRLTQLVADEVSITEASRSYLKSFFQKRGLYLTVALLVVIGIIFLSRLSLSALRRFVPGFRKTHRSFRVRLAELLHRSVTMVLIIIGPMVVFYVVEDWVLLSLGILLLLGIGWTLRQALPRYIKQIQLFLNIGSVREGERVSVDGLPWRVEQINVFSTLHNPTAGLTQRIPIEDLVDLKSRPTTHAEPWFPCREGDWVVLNDNVRGKVVAISPELVQLVQRGGALLTYQTDVFLGASPRNLATNFRIKETLGISYKLQKDSTGKIPETLHAYIQRRAEEEGYADHLLNMRVEFERANTSSLDLVVIADFKGDLGDLYNRLRRAIQRWGVDACTEYGWEIPFPQLTLHGTSTTKNI